MSYYLHLLSIKISRCDTCKRLAFTRNVPINATTNHRNYYAQLKNETGEFCLSSCEPVAMDSPSLAFHFLFLSEVHLNRWKRSLFLSSEKCYCVLIGQDTCLCLLQGWEINANMSMGYPKYKLKYFLML